jgi:hypothetical protein
LVVICCSTLVNCTNSDVNVLLSIGLDGSWFFSCVVSRLRKSLKLLLSVDSALVEVEVAAVLAAAVTPADAADVREVEEPVKDEMLPLMVMLRYAVMSTPARIQAG